MPEFFETRRLAARRFTTSDIDAFAAYRADPNVARYQSFDNYTRKDAEEFYNWVKARNPGEKGSFQFAIARRSDGAFIGDCVLESKEHDTRLAEIGYTLAPQFWGHGYATEAVAGLVSYAFRSFDFHRITVSVDPRNIASLRVIEKCGFRKEAHFRQSLWFKGAWADDVIYAMLRADWRSQT